MDTYISKYQLSSTNSSRPSITVTPMTTHPYPYTPTNLTSTFLTIRLDAAYIKPPPRSKSTHNHLYRAICVSHPPKVPHIYQRTAESSSFHNRESTSSSSRKYHGKRSPIPALRRLPRLDPPQPPRTESRHLAREAQYEPPR